ncbi:3-oxoacyl-ACP reductase [Bacillus sp. FJAT-27225]|uniref:elongation factor P 5-aminopentanone reductase n=1 Tax=Bacillus sp. FJAT-27225 TaxID=1743144 RepID=UPI00080C2225|nr:SDR family oxidoreductase [Bacillus sp. FJAT-27225]OCA85410.1 3-oxoacyl-ACP reductase [Bacillus sp. FJAT-27225]
MKKFALITGASGGIGMATARELAKNGYNLYLHYNSNEGHIKDLIEELSGLGGEYLAVKADFTQTAGYNELVSHIQNLDAIIHCSGNSVYGLLQDLADTEIQYLLNIHVMNPILLTRALLPKLLAKKTGNIVMVSSIWGQEGAACEAAYSAAKGAQIAFVKALGKELAPSGIRVNAVAPGAVRTGMLGGFSPDELEAISLDIPMGRLAEPEEIAKGIAFLISDHATYITGHVLSINGGWHT